MSGIYSGCWPCTKCHALRNWYDLSSCSMLSTMWDCTLCKPLQCASSMHLLIASLICGIIVQCCFQMFSVLYIHKYINNTFFPTCQVRVVRFYVSCLPPPCPPSPCPPPPRPPPPPPPPPDLNRKCRMAVFPGPQPRVPLGSVPRAQTHNHKHNRKHTITNTQ